MHSYHLPKAVIFVGIMLVWPLGFLKATDLANPEASGESIVSLQVTLSANALLVGESTQLQVLGSFADSSIRDLTADAGTRVQFFPEGVATLARVGHILGVAPGNAVILVEFGDTSGFASASVELSVRASGDRDGDGLPDEYEIQNQLNPDFAGDGDVDSDQDGLSNLREREAGTEPRLADTDGDTLPDGLEVAQGTDPLVPERTVEGESPQLNGNCVVSALNRSTRVQANGVWVLPNVPANTGRVRVRATCVENGVTRSGQSDFFTIPVNGVVRVAEIEFDDPEPVPVQMTLTAPQTVLTSVGQTVQLQASVRLPDGSFRDSTAAATGTGYISSNPAIASVSADGLVAARVSGTVLVSALNEGALGVLRLQIQLAGDTDGDGLPDDFELANGLDPNNPVDVLDDADDDGLSTGDEFQEGLRPFDPDTDDDRLRDGRELEAGTNPLLPDTDADRISDGLEILADSNPLDPASVSLARILESLTVRPGTLKLIFNTAFGEASRRLTVTGRLIDGTELDVRLGRYGTTYESSDLTIASFGAEGGVVFAGRDGTAVVMVAAGGRTATVQVTVESFSPTALSFLELPGFANGVAVAGDYAYVAAGQAGLVVVDVSDLQAPRIVGTANTPGNANDVRVSGSFAYVADGDRGLQIVDVSNPAAPRIAGSVDTRGTATDLAVRGSLVYVADGPLGVQVIDAANPEAPALRGSFPTVWARGIDVENNLAVVADGAGGVHVLDVSQPFAPRPLGSTHTRPNASSQAADVVVSRGFAYVADGAFSLGGLRVVDFRVPSTPVVVGSTSDAFGLTGVALDGGFVLASDYYYPNAVPIFDARATPPAFTAVLDFSRAPSFRDDNGNGIAARDGVVFLVGNRGYIADNGTWGSSGLHIGRYWLLQGDELGVAPEVRITAPAEGLSARERTTLTVRADATDDVRVTAVEFLINGMPAGRVFKAPFEARVTVPAGVASFSLGARATDLGGNEGTAAEVVVGVIPDNKPAVTLLAPSPGSRILSNTIVSIAATASDDVQVTAVEFRVDGFLRHTVTSPPYRFAFYVPGGAAQITVEAVARDSAGQRTTTGALTFPVEADSAPIVAVVAPASGTEVVQGGTIRVTAAATDDFGVTGVRLIVNGQPGPEDTTAPYETTVTVPATGSELRLAAEAMDVRGQSTTSEVVVLRVVPDPGTTAVGTVVFEDGSPVFNAQVLCQGLRGTSGAAGNFAISGVPTVVAALSCSASFTDAQGRVFTGTSTGVLPSLEGSTNVGPIVLTESTFENNLGRSLNLTRGESVGLTLPFAFPIFGTSYREVFINTNGTLSFVQASPRDSTESRDEFVSGFRDRDGVTVGPTIAAFWDDLHPQLNGEVDYFAFDGSAGDRVTAYVNAGVEGLYSAFDSALALFSPMGYVVAFSYDYGEGPDSRISATLPTTGRYLLKLQDYEGSGGANYSYTLTLDANGAARADAGREVEPNDIGELASPLRYGDSVTGLVDLLAFPNLQNIYINDEVPGRFVVTWKAVPEYPVVGSNTIQVILFSDGRIQFAYDGVTADDAIVGISPSNGGAFNVVDFSARVPFSTSGATAVFEEFDGYNGPDSMGEDPPGDRPFDLDGRALLFAPNADGGYNVSFLGAPRVPAAPRTSGEVAPRAVTGVVEGVVMPEGSVPASGLVVVITSSLDLGFEARVTTDANGSFRTEGVPAGGINAVAYQGTEPRAHAAGVLSEAGEVLKLELRPLSARPKP